MRPWLLSSAALLAAFCTARGEGLVFQLPADGSRAVFELDIKGMRQGGGETAFTGTLSMASVGRATENDEPCRWIEFQTKLKQKDNEHTVFVKVLIPEKRLKAGEAPLEHALRGWTKFVTKVDGEITQSKPEEIKDLKTSVTGPLPAFLSGPYQDARKLAKATIDCALGKVECDGMSGQKTFKQGKESIIVEFENRLHPTAPFGVAQCRLKFQAKLDGKDVESSVINLRLIEVGKGAKSAVEEASEVKGSSKTAG